MAADEGPLAGVAEAAPAASFFLNHECLAGEADAAAPGDAAAAAVMGAFFLCLCLEGLGEAPGVGLEVEVWASTDETEMTAKATRGMSFFMVSL
jgi:hypothetical protein